jgi:group I intron endonuclease
MPTFIYVIENRVNGHAYVGKTKVPEKRWKRHKDAASKCTEVSSWLYKAMSKHGVENFEFRIVDEHEDEAYALKVLEPMWIKRMKDSGVHLYNMTDGGDGIPGYTHSSATIKKISESNKGRKLSEEQKRHLSEINKGIKPTDEARRKISEANKGKSKPPRAEEHRKKLSEAASKRRKTADQRAKLSESMKASNNVGHPHSAETKEILRLKATGQVQSDETRAKRAESMRRSWERRRAQSLSAPDPITSSDQSS